MSLIPSYSVLCISKSPLTCWTKLLEVWREKEKRRRGEGDVRREQERSEKEQDKRREEELQGIV